INSVHLLPFYPYSSDDGFSVVDYYRVNPELGTWEDIQQLSEDYQLMFDAVINHISQASDWFQGFLAGDQTYAAYFIEEDPQKDYTRVVRPRVHPLLHDYVDAQGRTRHCWTTFSRDQLDLNYKNPRLFLHILDVLLFYAARGAQLIRLDAIGFLWKEDDSSCIHLPQTHQLIQVMRAVLESVFPGTIFITETNVPHEENISYFGDGYNEAQMVYNFTLPPLLAFSILRGDAQRFNHWARSLVLPSSEVCFFNFTASHDGVGLRPVQGILSAEEVQLLIDAATASGGRVSYKTDSDGSQSPYEINCNYFSLLQAGAGASPESIKRMLLSQAVLLAFPGVPALYFHSLFGSQNDTEGMLRSGSNRRINREKLNYERIHQELEAEEGPRHQIYSRLCELLRRRNEDARFHPLAPFAFPDFGESIIAIERQDRAGEQSLLLLFNVSAEPRILQLPRTGLRDCWSGNICSGELRLGAYDFAWLE
ncbi:MAG: alpha-amylase family glycosyl hydrolase, partial [Bacteroidota bacterium]